MNHDRPPRSSTVDALPDGNPSIPSDVASLTSTPFEASRPKPMLVRAGKGALFVVVVAFVLMTLYRLGKDFDPRDIHFRVWPVVTVTLVLVGANFAQAMAWVALLNRLAHRTLPRKSLSAVYCAGQLARYTPGKVALLVVRVAGAKRLGLDTRLVASSVGLEVLSWMTVGMLLGTTALAVSGDQLKGISQWLSQYSLLVSVSVVAGMLILLLVDRSRFPKFALRAIRIEGKGPILSWNVLGWQAVSWLGCVAQALLLPMSVGAPFGESMAFVGLFILAPIAGFLAMVAPGGLGVREAILSYALSPSMGPTRALTVALLARGVYVISEIIAWLFAKALEGREPTSS
jgi:hypothetical protein